MDQSLKILWQKMQSTRPLKVVIGADDVRQDGGWIFTRQSEFDVRDGERWAYFFGSNYADNFFAEHVIEHLTEEEARTCFDYAFKHMNQGGKFRIAVPDGNFPSQRYIEAVRPGGTGSGANDHKTLWTVETLTIQLTEAGFGVELLEFWDAAGHFFANPWSEAEGKVLRSIHNDDRNRGLDLSHPINGYTSLIVDAIRQ